MPKLPTLSPRKFIKVLKKAGFALDRIEGSHHIYWHEGHKKLVSVPFHKGRDLHRGLMHGLIKDAGLTVEEFLKLLHK